METEQPLDPHTVQTLIRAPEAPNCCANEEDEHCWCKPPYLLRYENLCRLPLLRIWDGFSGSPPNKHGGMSARAHRRRLDTRKSRVETLAIHADYGAWSDTPYISFTSSPAVVDRIIKRNMASGKRGPQKLTVVDPRYRLARGLPLIRFADEIMYYGIHDPYRSGYDHYANEFLCLWEVTHEEVVATWEWSRLEDNPRWYEEIVLPALMSFREQAIVPTTPLYSLQNHSDDDSGFDGFSYSSEDSDIDCERYLTSDGEDRSEDVEESTV